MAKKNLGNIDERVISDSDLVREVLGTKMKDRPLVFYRSLPSDPQVANLIKKSSLVMRPFSYAKPGIRKDIPLSYGRKDPVLFRIIDHIGEWEDTGPYLGSGNHWVEAMNLDPVRLRKISEGTFTASDLYRQVGTKSKDESKVWQGTYTVDEINPSLKISLLNELRNDPGFLRELIQRAEYFRSSNHPPMKKLNEKHLQYFDWAKSLSPAKVSDVEARKVLLDLKEQIAKLKP